MRLKAQVFSALLLIALLNQSLCENSHNINDVSKWKKSDVTDESKFEVSYLKNNNYKTNQLSLQLSDSKIVVVTYGYDNYPTDTSTMNFQIAIYGTDGKIIKSIQYEDDLNIEHVDLSLTNVEGEFIFFHSTSDKIYMTFYDENLKVKRGVEKEQLSEIESIVPEISLGNNLLYITLIYDIETIKVLILDLSDKSTYSIKKTYSYDDFTSQFGRTYSIQAYNDDTAVLYFLAINNSDEDKLIQVLYNSKGEQKSGYPKELESPFIDFDRQSYYYPWRSFLHNDKNTATFLASNNDNSLQIYTYSKDGDKVCSKTIDITGYNGENYYYQIIGDQGWAYLKDSTQDEGHFVLFNPKKCTMDLKNISDGTGIKEGMAGSLIDYDNEKILMFEFGNLLDSSNQVTIQANLYQIGSAKLDDKDDDEGSGFVLGFKTIAVILVALVLI